MRDIICITNMEQETLVMLIERIVDCRTKYDDDGCERCLDQMKATGNILSMRLDITTSSALAFAKIFVEASFGRLMTRESVVRFLPPDTNIVDRLECIWDLLDRSLIGCYQGGRNPIRTFFLTTSVCKAILQNCNPNEAEQNNALRKKGDRRITIAISSRSKSDYIILLDGNSTGFILHKSVGEGFDVFWLGKQIMEGDDIEVILESMNEMLSEGKLQSTQD